MRARVLQDRLPLIGGPPQDFLWCNDRVDVAMCKRRSEDDNTFYRAQVKRFGRTYTAYIQESDLELV